jgi:hypothetical protein
MAKAQLVINVTDAPFVINAIIAHAESLAAAIANQVYPQPAPAQAAPAEPTAKLSKHGKRLGRPPKKAKKVSNGAAA